MFRNTENRICFVLQSRVMCCAAFLSPGKLLRRQYAVEGAVAEPEVHLVSALAAVPVELQEGHGTGVITLGQKFFKFWELFCLGGLLVVAGVARRCYGRLGAGQDHGEV